jgi:hypothetical protein
LGAPLASRLSGDGIAVVDVPAKLAARVRVLSSGHRRKTDAADATSVGIAALSATRLRTVAIDEAVIALGPWLSTAMTWSRPAPRPSIGYTCC